MTRPVRKLNEKGIALFRDFIAAARRGQKASPPHQLLYDPATSAPTEGEARVEPMKFVSRLQAAEYLTAVLDGLGREEVDHSPGLWNWLSLFYFEELCPEVGGTRKVGKEYRYVLTPVSDPEHFRHYYRHLLAGAYTIHNLHASRDVGRILLCGAVEKFDDFNEQLASRQEFVTNSGLMGAVDVLYFDETKSKPKRGAASNKRKPGTLRRFVDVIQQLDLTYDLYSMTAKELVDILPGEFTRWARSSSAS